MASVLLVVLLAAVLAAGAYAALARFVIHGEVTPRTLFVSLEDKTGSAGLIFEDKGRCRKRSRPLLWRCTVRDREGSGGATYRVRMRPHSSCWDARLTEDESEGGMPDLLDGCVYRWE
jgi:hypothetical protein